MLVPWTVALSVLLLVGATPTADGVASSRWVSHALAEAMEGFAPSSRTNAQCNHDSRLYLDHLANLTFWAVKMLDSSSVSVGGLLGGDKYALGHYDQCLAVKTPIKAQHCLATLRYGPVPEMYPRFYSPPNVTFHEPPPSVSVWDKVKVTLDPGVTRRDVFHWALCVPASCTVHDLQESLNTTLEAVFNKSNLRGTVSVDPDYCHTFDEDEIPFSVGYFITGLIISLLLILSMLATVYDYFIHYHKDEKFETAIAQKSEKILMAFSLRKNMNELVEKGSDRRLDITNGAKVISIAAILFGHRIMYSYGLSLGNQGAWEPRLEKNFWENAIMNATHLVDIFFFCSGCLSFLGLYSVLQKRKRMNALLFYCLRWLRIVPPYLVMMGIVGWILPHMSEGPLWTKRVGLEAQRCQQNWWLNLLFINNYVHADNECLLLSWYLACDMQLFVVGMLAIYVLWRWPKVGYALVALLLVASIAIPFYVTYVGRYHGSLKFYSSTLLNDPFSNDQFSTVYVKTHNRAGPYIMGIITAYITTKLTDINYKFSTRTILIGTLVLFGGGYAHQTYAFLFYQRDRPYSALENALYAGLHRVTFAIGVAWISMSFFLQRFKPFAVIFAQPFYAPLGRLVYCLVLIHPTLQMAEAASVRHTEHIEYPKMIWMACADYLVANILALPLYLTVEAPCRTIVKILFMDDHRPRNVKNSPNNNAEETQAQPKQVIISRM